MEKLKNIPAGEAAQKPEMPAFTSYQRFVVLLLALLQFTVVLDFMVLSPLGHLLMKSMNMSTAQFGSVVSAYAISAGLSGILAAGFADKFDRKKMMVFFYSGFIIGTVFCGLANSYPALFAARVITGIFGGVISSIVMAIIADLFSLQQRGRVMGFVQMAFAVSQVLGIPLGIYLANNWGWNSTFYMVAALSVIVHALLIAYLKPITAHLKLQTDRHAFLHLWETVKNKQYRVGYLAMALLSLGGFMIMPFTSAFLVNNVGIIEKKLPLIFLFTGIGSIIIMPLIGRLSDRIDKFRLFVWGSALASVMIVIYCNLPPVHLAVVIAVNMVLFMGIMSRMVPATAINSAVPGIAERGAYMSVSTSLQQMSGGIGAIVAGLIVVQEPRTDLLKNFDVLGYLMVLTVLLCVFFVYRMDRLVKGRVKPAV